MLHTNLLRAAILSLDISTAVYDGSDLALASKDGSAQAILFDDDGDKFFYLGQGDDEIHKFTLSPNYDVTGSTDTLTSYDTSAVDALAVGMVYGKTSSKLYTLGTTNKTIKRHTCTTAFDAVGASYDGSSFDLDTSGDAATAVANCEISDNDDIIFVCETANDLIHAYTLSTAADPSSGTLAYSFDVTSILPVGTPRAIRFMPGGKIAVIVTTGGVLYQIELPIAWVLTSAIYNGIQFSSVASPIISTAYDVAFSPDGLKMVVLNQGSALAHPFTLTLA